MTEPVLSIILASYNYARYLPQALEALVTQTYPSFELIVVDDGSTDESPSIIKKYAEKYPCIRPFFFEENQGKKAPFACSQYALLQAKGEYYYFAAADDVVLPGFFEKSMALLKAYPEVGLCCSIPTFFQEERIHELVYHEWLQISNAVYLEPKALIKIFQKGRFWIAGHTSIYKKSAFFSVSQDLYSLKASYDWFINLCIAFQTGICYIPEPLAAMRKHGQCYSDKFNKEEKFKLYQEFWDVLKRPLYQKIRPSFLSSTCPLQLGKEFTEFMMDRRALWLEFGWHLWRRVFREKFKKKRQVIRASLKQKLSLAK